eukprot:gene4561-5158_t
MFLVFASMHYVEKPDEVIHPEVRREARGSGPEEPVPERPVFPDDYHSSGLLILPHSSIAEPFEIWFSTTLGSSRIDYYYGTDKSYQRGDEGENGKYYKVVPMYNDKRGNFEGCWTIEGTKYRPIFAQTVIPNMTWFKYVETEVYTGTLATKWHYEYWAYGMLNSQYVWVTKSKPHRPIRYEMKGYDAMLGSYYDHYVLEYVTFGKWRPLMKTFEPNPHIQCFNWSLTLESSLLVNPMQEFTPFSAEKIVDVDEMYSDYKERHRKSYSDQKKHKERKHIYKHNMRYIRSLNRKDNQFRLASNHFTDLTDDEFEAHIGSITKADPRNHTGLKPLHKHNPLYVGKPPKAVDIPEELDWRDYGAVSSVKGQGICGSCYTFSAAGAAEGAHFLKTGYLVELSSQQILDCSWGSGNHGCKGGHYAAALSFLYLHGGATFDSYGKYLAQEGVCHFNDTLLGAKPDAFAYVPRYNDSALKRSIAKYGPAAISINVSPMSFKFYSSGIYHDPDCWPNRTRHSALVIGYGSENGKEYWIVKNSWSDTWGEKGYMRVAMKGNVCGVTEAPVVALVNHVTFQFPVKEKVTSADSEDLAAWRGRMKDAKKKMSRKKTKSNKKAGKKMSGLNAKALEEQFQQKPTQPINMDDKETPKIEPLDQMHDMKSLGDAVVASDATSLAKDDINLENYRENNNKGKSYDFKLPVFQMNVDQSRLPNAFSESSVDGNVIDKKTQSDSIVPSRGESDSIVPSMGKGDSRVPSMGKGDSRVPSRGKGDSKVPSRGEGDSKVLSRSSVHKQHRSKNKKRHGEHSSDVLLKAKKNSQHEASSGKKTSKHHRNSKQLDPVTERNYKLLMETKKLLKNIQTVDKKSIINGVN